MSELDTFLVKSIEEIKADVKSIFKRLESITQDLHGYKNQKYKCQAGCDLRYLRLAETETLFKQEIEKFYEKRDRNAHRKSEIVKNIVNIFVALAPYIAMASTYIALTK